MSVNGVVFASKIMTYKDNVLFVRVNKNIFRPSGWNRIINDIPTTNGSSNNIRLATNDIGILLNKLIKNKLMKIAA